jgi:hypothetical protein
MPINPPPSAPNNAFVMKGLTTIRWGTDGFLQDPALQNGAAIVRSIKPKTRKEHITEENNAGFTVMDCLIIDGRDYEITVTDDTAKSWPGVGSIMALLDSTTPTPLGCLVIDAGENYERKKSGERTISAKFNFAYNF